MVLKVYISGMSGNKEVKKRQQRVLMILDSKNISYELIDITEPGKESEKEQMQNKSTSNGGTVSDPNPRHPLPPQIFNDNDYCGDYDAFDLANEIDTLEQFLKLAPAPAAAAEPTPTPDPAAVKAQAQAEAVEAAANGETKSKSESESESTAKDEINGTKVVDDADKTTTTTTNPSETDADAVAAAAVAVAGGEINGDKRENEV